MTTTTDDTATNSDYDEIVRVVRLYIDASNDGDIDKYKQAFHEDAWIFFTDALGICHKALLADCFEEWAAQTRATPIHVEGHVISVQQAGEVASVLLGFDNATERSDSWVDIHSLLRIDGVWKIMNKTATHSSRAGGA
ncbi:MAG TPA: nuclear transport factor 2 family protein [Chloroflexota bacterium]|nr:nuclear transport factor 2 family protein [Chloroflexota bacterium]